MSPSVSNMSSVETAFTSGVTEIFTPGATTRSIVDWVRDHVGSHAPG